MLIESLVMSRINYSCSLYYGLLGTSTKTYIESLDHRYLHIICIVCYFIYMIIFSSF